MIWFYINILPFRLYYWTNEKVGLHLVFKIHFIYHLFISCIEIAISPYDTTHRDVNKQNCVFVLFNAKHMKIVYTEENQHFKEPPKIVTVLIWGIFFCADEQ